MIIKVNKEIVSFLLKAELPNKTRASEDNYSNKENLKTSRPELITNQNTNNTKEVKQQKSQPIRVERKIGRNEKVKITNGTITKELKWKKAKPLPDSGSWTRA